MSTVASERHRQELLNFINELTAVENPLEEQASALEQYITNLLDTDVSCAERNQKKLTAVKQAVRDASLKQTLVKIDLLSQPLDKSINRLLARATALTKQFSTHATLVNHGQTAEIMQNNRSFFLQYVSGRFGEDLVRDLMATLTVQFHQASAVGLDQSSANATHMFKLVLNAASDVWRRFCLSFMSFPNILLSLYDKDLQVFEEMLNELLLAHQSCPKCCDLEFTTPILLYLQDFKSLAAEDKLKRFTEIQNLLGDLAAHVPLSSGAVEVRHGQLQETHEGRFRGQRKGQMRFAEYSLLHFVVTEFNLRKHVIGRTLMPATSNYIINRTQKVGRGKHSKEEVQGFEYVRCKFICTL